jgi:hypothetical protein
VDYRDLVFPFEGSGGGRRASSGGVAMGTPGLQAVNLQITTDQANLYVAGRFIGSLAAQNDLVRSEFKVQVQKGVEHGRHHRRSQKTPEGYVAPAGEDLRAWLAALVQRDFRGPTPPTFPTTPNGMLIDFATAIAGDVFLRGGAGGRANSGWVRRRVPASPLEKILSLFAFPRIPANSSVVNLVPVRRRRDGRRRAGRWSPAETTNLKFIVGQATNITGNVAYVVRVTAGGSPASNTPSRSTGNAHDFNSVIGTGQEIAEGPAGTRS